MYFCMYVFFFFNGSTLKASGVQSFLDPDALKIYNFYVPHKKESLTFLHVAHGF